MYVYMYICMYTCICVCIHVYMTQAIHTHAHTLTHTHTHIQTPTHTDAMRAHAHTDVRLCVCVSLCVHVFKCRKHRPVDATRAVTRLLAPLPMPIASERYNAHGLAHRMAARTKAPNPACSRRGSCLRVYSGDVAARDVHSAVAAFVDENQPATQSRKAITARVFALLSARPSAHQTQMAGR
jgi:hypothetical protein